MFTCIIIIIINFDSNKEVNKSSKIKNKKQKRKKMRQHINGFLFILCVTCFSISKILG